MIEAMNKIHYRNFISTISFFSLNLTFIFIFTSQALAITCFQDLDQDNYGSTVIIEDDGDGVCEAVDGESTVSTDCNDSNASVNPGATEICDGIDNNCNSLTDEDLIALLNPNQMGVCAGSKKTCEGASGWVVDYSSIATYEPVETTCDTLDNDCDAAVDENLTTTYYQDADIDTYGNPSVSQNVCLQPAGYVLDGTDCNDSNASVNPGATEICDGIDNNCNSLTDEGGVCRGGFWLMMMPAIFNGREINP
jgi:hypothetical protein